MSRAECEAQTKGFVQARFKKFDTEQEALDFIGGAAPAGKGAKPKPAADSDSGSGSESDEGLK